MGVVRSSAGPDPASHTNAMQLDSPGDPEDLWLAMGPEVSTHRMLMQGDIVLLGSGPVAVVTHACSMRQGTVLHATQMTAPIQSQSVGPSQWATGFLRLDAASRTCRGWRQTSSRPPADPPHGRNR